MDTTILPAEISPNSGLLNDKQIRESINAGYLFQKLSCDLSKVKYATYELRVSEDYHIVTYRDGQPNFTPKTVDESGKIIIEPGQTIKVLAKESFNIPKNIYVKINTVGQIFSAGLAAENTYADQGFNGQLYITLSNISSRRLSIKPNDPLARVEFHKLESPVEVPHSGQTGIRKNFVTVEADGNIRELLNSKTIEELMRDMVAQSVDEALQDRYVRSEVLIEKAHNEIGQLKTLKKIIIRLRSLFTAVVFLLSLAFAFWANVASILPVEQAWAIVTNVVAALITTGIIYLVQKRYV